MLFDYECKGAAICRWRLRHFVSKGNLELFSSSKILYTRFHSFCHLGCALKQRHYVRAGICCKLWQKSALTWLEITLFIHPLCSLSIASTTAVLRHHTSLHSYLSQIFTIGFLSGPGGKGSWTSHKLVIKTTGSLGRKDGAWGSTESMPISTRTNLMDPQSFSGLQGGGGCLVDQACDRPLRSP